MKYKIEKGIKLTSSQEYRLGQNKYPFKRMKVDDSFIIANIYSRDEMNRKSNAARNWKNKTGRKSWRFACRRTEKNEIRIWRVK